ncbi:hypothetical protein DPMN_041301 [Dreissena polymorpha]|uniref:Uncharacterized protein n=1 Tax=Dreissena polymorpha TaxID=45954 RepID=A0A9D4CWK6_DREPO|nr:hypothetical protein DPMN_041301 [Dreissena polymorpha]
MPVENIGGHRNVGLIMKRTTCKFHKTSVGHRSDTVYGCEVCNLHLCKECHVAYHKAV